MIVVSPREETKGVHFYELKLRLHKWKKQNKKKQKKKQTNNQMLPFNVKSNTKIDTFEQAYKDYSFKFLP